MHLGIDVREACRPKPAGKGRWTTGFVSELLSRGLPVTLFSDADLPASWRNLPNVHAVILPQSGLRWHLTVASQVRASSAIDCYVSPTSYIVPALLGRAKKSAVIVHDLIAFRNEPHERRATWIEGLTLGRAVRSAAHIFSISASTKRDLLARYPGLSAERITVIHAGPLRQTPKPNIGDRMTILCIGTLCPRKNQERLVQAFDLLPVDLRAKHDLLLAGGRGWNDEEIIRMAKEITGVRWAEYVTDDDYEDLLTHCEIFALPSLYEGFGMQILDALQRGMPVLTSGEGSLAEVAGDAALLVDPREASSIAAGLEKLLTNAALRESLRIRGPKQAAQFTWRRTVDLFLEGLGIGDSGYKARDDRHP